MTLALELGGAFVGGVGTGLVLVAVAAKLLVRRKLRQTPGLELLLGKPSKRWR